MPFDTYWYLSIPIDIHRYMSHLETIQVDGKSTKYGAVRVASAADIIPKQRERVIQLSLTAICRIIWFWPIWENSAIYVEISVHEQYSLLDTIFNYISYLDLQQNIYKQIEKSNYLGPAQPAYG